MESLAVILMVIIVLGALTGMAMAFGVFYLLHLAIKRFEDIEKGFKKW